MCADSWNRGSEVRWPWSRVTRTDQERKQAEVRAMAVRSHIRILVNELNQTLDRIADKADRMSHDR